ncbi:MAG: porin [Nitrosomonas sp.]|uniref:porin n=1 Tax=Nitrosomonas sp. TaxID=42353 RepID=UPI0025E3536F|nr:porin [Nitrosomonas sp.]UJP02659.1 MAG: porin [Nitrosomonas sp.]
MKSIVLVACLLTSASAFPQDSNKIIINAPSSPLTFGAYAETYYSYDFNNLIDNTKPPFLYSFNKNNEVSVNLASIKGSYTTDSIRANLALAGGTYMNANYAAEPGILGNFYEGNAGIKLSAGSNLWLDVGVFPSHIGFESAVGKDNWTLTRSLVAENTPYFESGAKISYTSDNDKWFLSALVLNGWQHIKPVDGNTIPAFGTQITYKPSPRVTLNSSTFLGSDKPDSARQMRYFHNFYAIFKLNDTLSTTIGFDIGVEQRTKDSSNMNTWFNPTIILKYTPTTKTAVAIRAEYYDDKHDVIIASDTSNGFKTWGFSANFDYNITSNLLWRIEARTLQSKGDIFIVNDGFARDSNTFITTSLAASF